MTDPLKLAEEIESTGAAKARLLAAALRLAEARVAYSDLRRRAPVSDFEEHRRREVEADDALITANKAEATYRAAREGR